MKSKKFNLKLDKTKTLILVGIITLLLFVGGATYAYFAFSSAGSISGNMNIISNTVDNLIFNVEKDIYINANLDNFGQGMADLHDDTDATATLIPNNSTNEATAMYNIYLIIEANDLEYTTEEHTPELLLNVTDPNGNPVENITGLVHHENGFDITTRTGGFLIASDYVINASNIAEVQTWNVEITLANLDSNQNANMNKTFSAKLYLTQDKMSSYNPVQINNMEVSPTYNTVDTSLNLSNGTADVAKYYFGIEETNTTTGYINNNNGVVRLNNKILASADTVEYQESDTPNYRFTGLKENTEYTIYSYVEDVNGVTSNVYETRVTTNEYRIPSVGEVTYSVTLNSITVNVNATGGDGNITKYMYSRNNGESWEESTSNTHIFTGLNDTTEYKIKIKVVDSNGRVSTEYYKAISTETYILPVVASVDATTTYNSITLTPSGTDGTGTIDHYLYSINNGEYQESNVFNNLNEQTEYTIRVKAVDSNGRETNPPYEIQVTTDAYQVPTITNVTTSSTTNSITINVSATNGDGTITKYMYSRDNGSNWYESTSNSYTFNNLTSNTTFYVQVKVVDNNNRESAVSNTTITTQYLNPVVNSVSTSNVTSNSVTLTMSATAGSNSIRTYYYSNNNGSSYVSSSSNTYTFNNLTPGTTYNFRVYAVDSGGRQSNYSTASATTSTPSLADVCSNGNNLASCIKTFYNTYGEGTYGLYYHNGSGNYSNANQEAGDYSYRYAGGDYQIASEYKDIYTKIYEDLVVFTCGGEVSEMQYCWDDFYFTLAYDTNQKQYYTLNSVLSQAVNDGFLTKDNVKNFVCFGNDCSNMDNLYRIIGVFDNQVKLVKYDYASNNLLGTDGNFDRTTNVGDSYTYKGYLNVVDEYIFTKYGEDDWSDSAMSLTNLNINYLNNIGSAWANKISNHTWNIEGMDYYVGLDIPKTSYADEMDVSDVKYTTKIGAIYINDYAYAASPENWLTRLEEYRSAADDDWLHMGLTEWTISLRSSNPGAGFILGATGSISAQAGTGNSMIIRPTFYLNSNVTYVSGTGTQSNPYRIN